MEANGSDWDAFRCCWALWDSWDLDIVTPDDPDAGTSCSISPDDWRSSIRRSATCRGNLQRGAGPTLDDFIKTGGQEDWADFSSTSRMPTIVGSAQLEMSMTVWSSREATSWRVANSRVDPPTATSWPLNGDGLEGQLLSEHTRYAVRRPSVLSATGSSAERRLHEPRRRYPTTTALPKEWSVSLPLPLQRHRS